MLNNFYHLWPIYNICPTKRWNAVLNRVSDELEQRGIYCRSIIIDKIASTRWKVSSMQLSQESETPRTGRSSVSLHCTRISLSGEYDRCTWVKKYMKRKKDYVTDSRSDSHNDRWVWDRIFTRGFLSHAGNTILDREIPVDACTALEINRILSVQPPRRDSWTMNVPGLCVEGETFVGFGFRNDRGNELVRGISV